MSKHKHVGAKRKPAKPRMLAGRGPSFRSGAEMGLELRAISGCLRVLADELEDAGSVAGYLHGQVAGQVDVDELLRQAFSPSS